MQLSLLRSYKTFLISFSIERLFERSLYIDHLPFHPVLRSRRKRPTINIGLFDLKLTNVHLDQGKVNLLSDLGIFRFYIIQEKYTD